MVVGYTNTLVLVMVTIFIVARTLFASSNILSSGASLSFGSLSGAQTLLIQTVFEPE